MEKMDVKGSIYFIQEKEYGFIGSYQNLSSNLIDLNKCQKFYKRDGFTNIDLVKNYVKKYFKGVKNV